MGLSLRGQTSGAVDINAPAVAGDNTITLPDGNGSANQFYKNSTTAGIVTHSSMVEDANGNVGIGTTNPQRSLHIYTGDNAQLVLESPDTLNDINLTDTGGSARIRNTGGELRFFTGGDPSSVNVANGSNNVAITTDGNMEIANGNLVFSTAGTGIDFSATADGSGTTTSELLDDYEEGTWTVRYSGRTTNGTITNNRTANAEYIKIGKQVTVMFDFDQTLSGASGDWQILGLPFSVHTGPYHRYTGSIVLSNNSVTWSGTPLLYANDGGTFIWLVQNNSGTSYSFLSAANARMEAWGVLTYFTD